MKKRTICIAILFITCTLLAACSQSWVCHECKEEFTGTAYYDMKGSKDQVMCEECAIKYWMPLDYRTYKVK